MIDLNQKLGKYLTVGEAIFSSTAKRKGIENIPDPALIINAQKLCEKIYDPLCDHFGGNKLFFDSFFRCVKLNKAIGGSSSSQHCEFKAIDLNPNRSTGIKNIEIYKAVQYLNLPFDQMIFEFGFNDAPDWVHVSYDENRNRRSILRSFKDSKNETYYVKQNSLLA
jgi:zinc D-Ala-D-Ala carboxypeptidase